MSNNVFLKATNQPECDDPIEFDFTPVAPLWISEVLVYLNPTPNPPPVFGKIHPGTSNHPAHLTVFVDQPTYDQICNCLGGSAVDLSLDYDDGASPAVLGIRCVAESLRIVLTDIKEQLATISKTFAALQKAVERRVDRISHVAELAEKKTG